MMLNILVVDDETLARTRLRTLLGDCTAPAARVAGEAANAAQAVELLGRGPVDAVLLDIHMPGADGLTLAKTLRAMADAPAVVFVTAHAEHAVQAFELEAVDYLTKPVRLERLQAALQKVERSIAIRHGLEPEKPEEMLVIQDRGRTERVPVSEVLYLKAELKYVTVRTVTYFSSALRYSTSDTGTRSVRPRSWMTSISSGFSGSSPCRMAILRSTFCNAACRRSSRTGLVR